MIKIIYSDHFKKRVRKFVKKHPDLVQQYEKTIELLELNPHHPSLRLHKLTGKLSDLYSVYINITYRLSIEFLIQDEKIIPVDIGTHEEVY
ncbi:MAG: type II toxin-antitoxin system mRNA interferase toxin, RelE/StbE family [Candidatus Delongbacteria bacterium]|nr:type II toxin-antitoxin system mRNA interferase toxin, RelE/StbE family [Candidatus Delongbacteria bacterium]MDD4204482.1 type II toxin-antitoxin system mRNA interferase toxin, RelE/StbE family [Candidatus Delongbacteria bacterium]